MRSHGVSVRRAGSSRVPGLAAIALCWIATLLGAQGSGAVDPDRTMEPGIRLKATPLSDFYFTLRTSSPSDPSSGLPQPTRAAAARLQDLTTFLPDSLPLKTPANTVLIVHRKNPKYTATIDRLLWRRLDPGLGTLRSPEDLSRVLPEIIADLQPLCGNKVDSIRIGLSDLYKSAYPMYLTSTWPTHHRETSAWIREFERLYLPREKDALAGLSKQLALPLGDSSQVRILVVGSGVPEDGILYASRDRSYVSVVIPARGSGYQAVGRVLHWYLKSSEVLRADSSATVPHLLEQALQKAHATPALVRDLTDALIDYAIARTVADLYGNETLLASAGAEQPYMPALRRAWNAHNAGALSTEEACRSIAEAAAARPK